MTAKSARRNPDDVPTDPVGIHKENVFKKSAFEYVFLTSVKHAYNQVGDVGEECVVLIRQVEDGKL